MINQNLHLNPKLFDEDIEMKPSRDGFGEGLVIAAEENPNVVGLCADLTESTRMEAFKKKFPERFVEVGVAEQNMVTVASGMALVGIMDKKPWRVYCVTSDGEHQEGNTWEAIMFAANYKLGNLTVIMDRNNMQIDGHTEDIMSLNPVADKYRAFNWNVIEINGHNFQEIIDACEFAKTVYEKPTIIIAHTIPGKGVSYMENRYEWHGAPPDSMDISGAPSKGEQAREALRQLMEIEEKVKND